MTAPQQMQPGAQLERATAATVAAVGVQQVAEIAGSQAQQHSAKWLVLPCPKTPPGNNNLTKEQRTTTSRQFTMQQRCKVAGNSYRHALVLPGY